MDLPVEKFIVALTPTSREYAIITWVIIIAFFSILYLLKVNKLDSLKSLLKQLFNIKLMTPILIYVFWFSIIVYLLELIGWWNLEFLKMTLLWFALEGILILFSTILVNNTKQVSLKFKKFVLQAISISAIVVIVINLYTFNYFIELVIVFLITLLSLFIGFLQSHRGNEYHMSLRVMYMIAGSITTILLLFSIVNFILKFNGDTVFRVINEYFISVIYCIWVLPFVYILKLYATYEVIWIVINNFKYIPEKIRISMLLHLIKNCHFNHDKLEKFRADSKWRNTLIKSKKDIRNYFKEFNDFYYERNR